MHKTTFQFIIAAGLVTAAGMSSATSASCNLDLFPSSLMLNVSTSGWASKEEPVRACTIINPEIQSQGVAFFSETDTQDAVIEVRYVDRNFPSRFGDDWKRDLPQSQQSFLPLNLCAPARETDAAVILHIDHSLYPAPANGMEVLFGSHRFGVCAVGYPKAGRAFTSVSITTLRDFSCPWHGTIPPVNYFER